MSRCSQGDWRNGQDDGKRAVGSDIVKDNLKSIEVLDNFGERCILKFIDLGIKVAHNDSGRGGIHGSRLAINPHLSETKRKN